MPVLDGFQVYYGIILKTAQIITKMMNQGLLDYLPIVAVTAYASSAVTQKCFESGMCRVSNFNYSILLVHKPLMLEKLNEILNQFYY